MLVVVASLPAAAALERGEGALEARGARALYYQRHAISSLVAIAEMAAAQGYDLYALESEDHGSLRRAIEFLLDGIAHPELVLPYAQENENPGPFRNYLVQDLSFMVRRGHGRPGRKPAMAAHIRQHFAADGSARGSPLAERG